MTFAQKRISLLDSVALLLLGVLLIAPLFGIEYLNNWSSIESTFISDARLLAEHMPHPGWQPLWYCGTRFDYIYPPALRYGTALIALIGSVSTARAYHIYTGLLYILGPVSVYWLVVLGSGSRKLAWLSALLVAVCSPSLILIPELGRDSPLMIPQRLHVLTTYGEGPHISALSVLPAALAAAFVVFRRWHSAAFVTAAILSAFTVANNFYGATALAVLFPIAAWSVWLGTGDRLVWLRAAGMAALAYGLSAFWLTPSFVQLTLLNMKWVSAPGDTRSRLIALAALMVFCVVSYRFASRQPERTWIVFVVGAAFLLSVDVLGYYYFRLRVLGQAQRLAPELDMALLLFFGALAERLWTAPKMRFGAVALVLVVLIPATRYIHHAWSPFVSDLSWQNSYQYRITDWVHENLPAERVMPPGSIRFWLDAWFDIPEPHGGSDQGMIDQTLPVAWYQIFAGDRGEPAVLWLQALGTSAVIAPDTSSPEPYRDFTSPGKFRGLLAILFDDQHGTVIYRVPRIYRSIGRVVNRDGLKAIGPIVTGDDLEKLRQYVSLIENPQQAETTIAWSGFDALHMNATVRDGESVLLQETWDPSWQASENGLPLTIRRDTVMGFMLIDLPPGNHAIDLHFRTPIENRAGLIVLALSLMTIVWLVRPRPALTNAETR